jgi:hypothetical protein
VVSDAFGLRKPRAEIFAEVVTRLGVAPAETLHVGDSLRADVAGAANAGLRTAWITRRVSDVPARSPRTRARARSRDRRSRRAARARRRRRLAQAADEEVARARLDDRLVALAGLAAEQLHLGVVGPRRDHARDPARVELARDSARAGGRSGS